MNTTSVICETVGPIGRMISGSKSGYMSSRENHLVIFNANLCLEGEGKVWYGDLDVTLDKERLAAAAVSLGQDVYVLREMDARFENESKPKLKEAIVIFKADGTTKIGKNSVYTVIDPVELKINR